ncbi:MAG: STAS domain-containing protein [Magnetococcales bacterium]|nr:STAS domain-containing protein [Magnetococcales bacterium]NGZ27403.1 STAS domain-containing protein [Magnetococcales bacterium]
MEIEQEQKGTFWVVTPHGRIDSSTSSLFEERLMALLQSGGTDLVLDFRHIDYISSAGLRVLLMAAKRVKPKGGRVALCAVQAHIHEVFRVSGFTSLFQFFSTLDDALSQ